MGGKPSSENPRAIFLFRFVPDPQGAKPRNVHHFSMIEANSYLLALRFAFKDKDELYNGKAEANQPTKLVQIVSQLFFPLVTPEGVISRPN